MRTLWTFVPGLVLLVGAFGLADLRMHSEQGNGSIDCGSLVSGMPHKYTVAIGIGFVPGPGPTCGTQRDARAVEVAGAAGLGVLLLGGAAWLRHRDAPLRD